MGGIQFDTSPLTADLDALLTEMCSTIRDGADRAAEVAAVEAESRCGGVFRVVAEPGERRYPIGGFHNAGVRVERLHQAPKSPYYVDPGGAAAWFYEYGTIHQPPRPFIRPGLLAGIEAL